MTDSEMAIRTMINGLKDIPKMTDKRQVARRVRGLILALKDLQAWHDRVDGDPVGRELRRRRADHGLHRRLDKLRPKRKKT